MIPVTHVPSAEDPSLNIPSGAVAAPQGGVRPARRCFSLPVNGSAPARFPQLRIGEIAERAERVRKQLGERFPEEITWVGGARYTLSNEVAADLGARWPEVQALYEKAGLRARLSTRMELVSFLEYTVEGGAAPSFKQHTDTTNYLIVGGYV